MAQKKDNEMSFLEHLEVLRWHIIKSIASILVFGIVAFIFKDILFNKILLAPKFPDFITYRIFCKVGEMVKIPRLCINAVPMELISIKMSGQFSMHIMTSLIAGFIVSFPYVFYQFWKFIVPALYPKEKKVARGAVAISSLLFLLGVFFGYFIITPLTVQFFSSYSVSDEVSNQINLISFVSTIASVLLSTGVVFELPILVFFLSKIGLITPKFMKKYRKHSFVLILLLAAIITPPDIFSQLVVSLPLIILYEISIVISRRVERKRLKKEAAESLVSPIIN
jgi:sec-independent protein translocase protein TatC